MKKLTILLILAVAGGSTATGNKPEYVSQRLPVEERLFVSEAVEREIVRVQGLLTNPKLAWMFGNCFPNTLETTVHFRETADGPDTFVVTGDIAAMWLRDSGAQVWPYVRFAASDGALRRMIAGVINRQLDCINIDPYANAFSDGPTGAGWQTDGTRMKPEVYERKWEIDSHCYPVRLAYEYWKTTGDTSVFGERWTEAVGNMLTTFRQQQRKSSPGPYSFLRTTDRQYSFLRTTDRQLDTKSNWGWGNPVNPVGLIASAFRPSDDATTFEFLVPVNFFAVTSLRKAAEILEEVNGLPGLARECRDLAQEVEDALKEYATYEHPVYGTIYAYEVDGFGNRYLMDDANVPSLLSMAYLGDVDPADPVYINTRRFVLSGDNPYFFSGKAGEGTGSPHIGRYNMVWPMGIMMRAFTSTDEEEIKICIEMLIDTDAETGFMHESFDKDDASNYTRPWFAWQNSLFGELILKLIEDGKLHLLNSVNSHQ